MVKRTRKKTVTKLSIDLRDNTDLRRWCIEQATHWPTYTVGYGHVAQGIGGMAGPGYSNQDADVIGRAKKILDWVLTSHL
jgi:hypothetical protein